MSPWNWVAILSAIFIVWALVYFVIPSRYRVDKNGYKFRIPFRGE